MNINLSKNSHDVNYTSRRIGFNFTPRDWLLRFHRDTIERFAYVVIGPFELFCEW